jgi:hypothetical protein
MIKGADVLEFLLPAGGWTITGDDYEGITFLEATPITKEQFLAGFPLAQAAKAQADQAKANEKAALLAKLGITEDEARLLLS